MTGGTKTPPNDAAPSPAGALLDGRAAGASLPSLKALTAQGDLAAAWRCLADLAATVEDYPTLAALCRARRKLASAGSREGARRTVRIALLGGATTELLEEPLQLFVETLGLDAVIHRADFNTFAPEMLDADSATARFRPDVVVLVTTPANLPQWPAVDADLAAVGRMVDDTCAYWLDLCARLHAHTPCEIVLNNFHPLPTRPLGNLAAKTPWDANNFLRRVNLRLGELAPPYVHINDVESLAAERGVRHWFDPRYWFHAKQPVSFTCLAAYVRNTARIIGALFGCTAKCLVLDLDNTLWGGVVGDDGVDGIRIGEGDAVSEAFKAFQEYLLKLKQRGVMLAVCSKNELPNALAAFRERRDMVLKRDDFVGFIANWDPKPDNLIQLAAELNIGLNAFVFVDDNPAEREHVRQRLPEVKVIELTDDPADYPRLVDESGYFEIAAISAEDRRRTQQYQSNIERERLRESAGDYQSYLATLDQRAVIRPFEEKHLERITQLINKSNQFNLTTLRLSRSQVEEKMRDENHLTVYVRLADRFGDNGLISVFAAHRERDSLVIDLWLMSCRVLKRGVESLLLNHVADRARSMGVSFLDGVYRPTAKNALVGEHYPRLGFQALKSESDGTSYWRLALSAFRPADVPIAVVDDYG